MYVQFCFAGTLRKLSAVVSNRRFIDEICYLESATKKKLDKQKKSRFQNNGLQILLVYFEMIRIAMVYIIALYITGKKLVMQKTFLWTVTISIDV